MLRKRTLSLLLVLALAGFGARQGLAGPGAPGAGSEYYGDDEGYYDDIGGERVRPGLGMLLRGGCITMEEPSFIDGRLAFLKAELGVTDAQNTAWQAYSQAVRRHFDTLKSSLHSMKEARESKTPVGRLDARISSVENRLKSLKDLKPALESLNNSLTAEQRTKADELFGSLSCMR